ncbi:MAG: restriction endonuclease subunit S [Chloroflexi bacterium]|nr:restriction endonuclease subunit S [Chloroflexota bacterium]
MSEVPYAGVRLNGRGVYRREAVRSDRVKASTLTRLRQGQVVYNRMWATRGSFGVAGPAVDGCLVTNDFPVFDVLADVERRYLALLFETREFQATAASAAVGTTERKRLLERDFLRLSIDLPPLAEQHRIVGLVLSVDEAVNAAEREVRALAELRRLAILAAIGSQSGQAVPMPTVLELVIGGAWGDPPGTQDGDADALNLLVFNNQSLTIDATHSTPRSFTRARLNGRALQVDDILLERSGGTNDRAVGRVVYADRELPDVVPTDFMRLLRVKRDLAEPRFIFWHLWARYQRGETVAYQSKTTNIRNLRVNDYLALPITLPSREEQIRVVRLGESLTHVLGAATRLAARYSALRLVLLRDLLSGGHEIPGSYDRFLDGAV